MSTATQSLANQLVGAGKPGINDVKGDTLDTGFNKIMDVSGYEDTFKACRGSFIVKRTTQYCSPKTKSGLILPADNDADMVDKKLNIGEVVCAGSECKEIKKGDIVVYQRLAAMRLPNGLNEPIYFKLEETPMAVVLILPPQPEADRIPFSEQEVKSCAN